MAVDHAPLPPQVLKAFVALGEAQRGRPEEAMLRVQEAMGGGVLDPVVENVGDLTHRMTHMLAWGQPYRSGYEYVRPKIEVALRALTHKYGFEKELRENVENNARYHREDPAKRWSKIAQALDAYAAAHDRLPVYNQAQYLAKKTAVAVGRREFDKAVRYLRGLESMSATPERWDRFALDYHLDAESAPAPYPWVRAAKSKKNPRKIRAEEKAKTLAEILGMLGYRH